MIASPVSAKTSELGFTLLELLIGLVILSLALAVVVPRLSSRSETATLRTTALQIASSLSLVRSNAMRGNLSSDLIVDLTTKRYWAEGAVKIRAVPNTFRILAGHTWREPTAVSRAAIHFNADGSSNGGWIGLETKRARADIAVDWMTGATRITFGR
jgi:general secretion pathway protein H